ncbi:MAG TPA: formate dehydrogenase, partial [Methylomirabilota bacterium]|nr:formate dehydrogenase [Methylomirabilota bacterium]
DPDRVRRNMANVPMRVHQDIILTDQMFIPANGDVLLLPAKTRYEQDDGGIETTTERRIAFTPEIPRQVGEARAEWKIMLELARRVYPERANLLGCENGWKVREEIARVVPFYEGCQHLRKTGDAVQYGGKHLCADGKFQTPDGKAHFRAVPLPDLSREAGEFEVSTRRGKQFNTLIYAEIDPLTGAPRDAVFISSSDATKLNLRQGEPIKLVNKHGEYYGSVFIADIAPGNLQVHWPEGNVLIPHGLVDKGGGVPDYNARVRIERAPACAAA